MKENITPCELIAELDKVIQNCIDDAKKQNRKPTREIIIETITNRLDELIKADPGNKERIWLISGIAVGAAIILQIDDRLKTIE